MIRNRTTLVVGAGASTELQMPGNEELLSRAGQAFDFSRFGTGLQTKDSVLLAHHLQRIANEVGKSHEDIVAAADRIRIAAKLARSIDDLLDQNDSDPLVAVAVRLGIVHFICQAEARSILRPEPRVAGDLPVQGTDTWLYQLGQLVTAGVPCSQAERCFDRLAIVCFNYDRSIEHFLPHALVMAFGMELDEAQAIVAEKLEIIHPHGMVGRLPWQPGDGPACEWACEEPANLAELAGLIRSAGEVSADEAMLGRMRGMVAQARRIVVLGFGFLPRNLGLLTDGELSRDQEVVTTVQGLSSGNRAAAVRALRRMFGVTDDDRLTMLDGRCTELLRDYSLLLES